MLANKDHWYDGWIYDRLIVPHQDRLFAQIKELIPRGSSVLDVGCGTGRLAFVLADKCRGIIGIDLSTRNIERARWTLAAKPNDMISFEHATVTDILNSRNGHFDYAVLTYVLHEVSEKERGPLLMEISRAADTILIGDYLLPVQPGWTSWINEAVEYAAGSEHYTNFKTYEARGGILPLVGSLPFRILHETKNTPPTSHVVMLQLNEARTTKRDSVESE